MASHAARDPPGHAENPKLKLKPVIAELIRTQVCPKPLELLLDRIAIVPVFAKGQQQEAYRLWLCDGLLSIQGLIRHELHPFVTSGSIHEGSIVALDDYGLTKLPKQSGEGFVWILTIRDFQAIGSDGRAYNPPRIEDVPGLPTKGEDEKADDETKPARDSTPIPEIKACEENNCECKLSYSPSRPKIEIAYEEEKPADVKVLPRKSPAHHIQSPRSPETRPKSGGSSTKSDTSEPLKGAKRKHISATSSQELAERQQQPSAKRRKSEDDYKPLDVQKLLNKASSRTFKSPILQPITRALNIMPLQRVTGPNRSRNKVLDVLAVVISVDLQVIRRPKMPEQRNIRITDTSTAKHVQLTVFVDAEDFTPRPGTVALFRNVTTHEWNGGSLKAYQRDCLGKEWYFPDPKNVDHTKVEELKALWEEIEDGDERQISNGSTQTR